MIEDEGGTMRISGLGINANGQVWRLPGMDGSAVFLQGVTIPARAEDTDAVQLAVDIGLLSGHRFVQYLRRPIGDDMVDGLARTLFAAADDIYPEQSVPTFTDDTAGFALSVVGSTEATVRLEVTVAVDLAAGIRELDCVAFDTSRVALASAALQIRELDGSWEQDNVGEEI